MARAASQVARFAFLGQEYCPEVLTVYVPLFAVRLR